MNGDVIKMSFPARPEYILAVRLAVSAIAQRVGFSVDDIEDFKVASAEACVLLLSVGPEGMDISIAVDDGLRIEVSAVGTPCGADEADETSELSQYLLEALVDTCELKETDGALKSVVIYKKK